VSPIIVKVFADTTARRTTTDTDRAPAATTVPAKTRPGYGLDYETWHAHIAGAGR
jgi:hypothetical protein